MGLLYSITQTLYEYIYPSTKIILNPQKIRLFSQKLSHGIQQRLLSLKNSNFKLQNDFINKINTQKKRDKYNQDILINHLIMQAIKCGVYQQLLNCTKRIQQQAQIISKGLDKVSQQCLTGIFSIVHLYRDFELNQFIDLKEFLPEPYPTISVDKLDSNIRRYLKYKKPSQYERNLYVVEMCKRHQGKISVLKLNQANHGYSQHPQKNLQNEQKQFNSNGLYARSASYHIDQEQNYSVSYNQKYQRQIDQFAA